jgi:hypothetical protein
VKYPEAPSENKAAERAVLPAVIARKISGGTRSRKGSETKMTLIGHPLKKSVIMKCEQLPKLAFLDKYML